MNRQSNGRTAFLRAAILFFGTLTFIASAVAVFHPDSPLPDAWNPIKPFHVADPYTPLTDWKLSNALADPEACRAALAEVSTFRATGQKPNENPQCGIANTVVVRDILGVAFSRLETDCQTALRTAMWISFDLAPLASKHMNTRLTGIDHFGSFSCRKIRTTSGIESRYSTHAKALAIDVAGFRFQDGTRLRLQDDWNDAGAAEDYLRHARDGACDWFKTTLSPDYNSLHADHFHLQAVGRGTCR